MARPKIEVKQFVVCRGAPWEGVPGPRTARTLEGVCHRIGVPPGTNKGDPVHAGNDARPRPCRACYLPDSSDWRGPRGVGVARDGRGGESGAV